MARILIAEDSYIQAAAIERILLEAGHDVVGMAPRARAALEIVRIQPPELLVFCRELALDPDEENVPAELHRLYGCKVLITTGYSAEVDFQIGGEPCGILRKPYSDEALLHAVDACMRPGPPVARSARPQPAQREADGARAAERAGGSAAAPRRETPSFIHGASATGVRPAAEEEQSRRPGGAGSMLPRLTLDRRAQLLVLQAGLHGPTPIVTLAQITLGRLVASHLRR
jgi:CheY-like chemotaxis protein